MARDDDEIDELRKAIKARILSEVTGRSQTQSASIVNNLYGGGGAREGGLQDRFDPTEDPFDYKVDIERRAVLDAAGENIGWDKKVHRYRAPKDGEAKKKRKIGFGP